MTQTSFRRLTVATGVLIACFATILLLDLPSERGAVIISNVGQCLAPALAAMACLIAAGRGISRRHKLGWRLLGASALSWSLLVRGCLAVCRSVPLRQWRGVASGSFRAPAHAWPAHLELRLTATDRGGLTATRTLRLDPATATVRLRASVPGLRLRLDRTRPRSPVARTVIAGSVATVAAPAVQRGRRGTGRRYRFCGWSDGRPRAHRVTVRHDATLVARYARRRHDGGAARCPRPAGRPR